MEFDKWFRGREFRRKIKKHPIQGDSFILGFGQNGFNLWAEMLDLLRIMTVIGVIDAREVKERLVIYSLSI